MVTLPLLPTLGVNRPLRETCPERPLLSIRLDGPAYRTVTKTVHKTLPGGGRGEGVVGWGGGDLTLCPDN